MMIATGQRVNLIGTFVVAGIQNGYVVLDSLEKGTEEVSNAYDEAGFVELDESGKAKEFDGFQEGDFFKFTGELTIMRSNETYTKLQLLDGTVISVPNHKIAEVN